LLFVNFVVVLFTLFAYASPHIDPSNTYFFSFFGLVYPFLLLLNVLFVFIWLFFKKSYTLVSIITLLVGYSYVFSFVKLDKPKEPNKVTNKLEVLSFNLQKVHSIRNRNGTINEKAKTNFVQFLLDNTNIGILCAQETSSTGFNLIKEELKYPHDIRSKEKGVNIFSIYPIIDQGEVDLNSDKTSSAIWADLNIHNDTIRIYNVHLHSNKISKPAEEMMQDADLQSSKTWKSIRGILANYKNSTIMRTKQAKVIVEHTSKSPYPTIICGDFNDTPLSYVYNILAKNKTDSFKQSGSGIGTTYAGIIPALRIDYILADERLDIVRHSVLRENYSDHYPISVEIVLP